MMITDTLKIDLTEYEPKASKFKAILKKHGITNGRTAFCNAE